jgi:hypothetical protein
VSRFRVEGKGGEVGDEIMCGGERVKDETG